MLPRNYHVLSDTAFRGVRNTKVPRPMHKGDNEIYNKNISLQRVLVETAFGISKMKFKKFRHPQIKGEDARFIKHFIGVVVIHNILINFNEFKLNN